MNVTLSDIIVLTLRRIYEDARQGKGKYISFKSSKLADDILRIVKVNYSRVLIRYLIKQVLDVLCTELKCEKRETGRGTIYSFDRNSILNSDLNSLVERVSNKSAH